MEYFVARRIVNYINRGEKELILKYSQEINTDETLSYIEDIIDIEWAIKPHAYQELEAKIKSVAKNIGNNGCNGKEIDELIKQIHIRKDNFQTIFETIDFYKNEYLLEIAD
jgi:hypothetical protein